MLIQAAFQNKASHTVEIDCYTGEEPALTDYPQDHLMFDKLLHVLVGIDKSIAGRGACLPA